MINFLEFNKYIKNIAHTSEFMSKITSVSQDMSYVKREKAWILRNWISLTVIKQILYEANKRVSLNITCEILLFSKNYKQHLKEFVNKLLSSFNCVLLVFMYINPYPTNVENMVSS